MGDEPQLSILDDATQKLLESDDDENTALQRYDTGDPQFMTHAYDDMRKLDVLLQERFSYEHGLRKKRRHHLTKLHQTLSEFQVTQHGRQESLREVENARKFFSATDLQHRTLDRALESDEDKDTGDIPEETRSEISSTRLTSYNSSLSIPKMIDREELGNLDDEWCLVPYEETDDDAGSFVAPSYLSGPADSDAQSNFVESEAAPDTIGKKTFSFRFGTVPPPVDHVKRNILLAGQLYYTPEEKIGLEQLLTEPASADGNLDVTTVTQATPFSLFGEDLQALRHIEEMLLAIKQSQSCPSNTESSVGVSEDAFHKITDDEQNAILSRRFCEITDRILEIESAEREMLSKIFHGEDVEPLESMEKIIQALHDSEHELLALPSNQRMPAENSQAVVPFVSESELQLLLGPFPRCTNYPELNAKQWNAESFAMWKDWLEERRQSIDALHEELETAKMNCQNKDDNDDLIAAKDTEERFRSIMNDLMNVKSEIDLLLSTNGSACDGSFNTLNSDPTEFIQESRLHTDVVS